jgi:hypothetical protein
MYLTKKNLEIVFRVTELLTVLFLLGFVISSVEIIRPYIEQNYLCSIVKFLLNFIFPFLSLFLIFRIKNENIFCKMYMVYGLSFLLYGNLNYIIHVNFCGDSEKERFCNFYKNFAGVIVFSMTTYLYKSRIMNIFNIIFVSTTIIFANIIDQNITKQKEGIFISIITFMTIILMSIFSISKFNFNIYFHKIAEDIICGIISVCLIVSFIGNIMQDLIFLNFCVLFILFIIIFICKEFKYEVIFFVALIVNYIYYLIKYIDNKYKFFIVCTINLGLLTYVSYKLKKLK